MRLPTNGKPLARDTRRGTTRPSITHPRPTSTGLHWCGATNTWNVPVLVKSVGISRTLQGINVTTVFRVSCCAVRAAPPDRPARWGGGRRAGAGVRRRETGAQSPFRCLSRRAHWLLLKPPLAALRRRRDSAAGRGAWPKSGRVIRGRSRAAAFETRRAEPCAPARRPARTSSRAFFGA
jgi:hypothetical protein